MTTTWTLTSKTLGRLSRPCVYAWRRGDVWMYVGRTVRGVAPAVLGAPGHPAIDVTRWGRRDRLVVWFVPDEAAAAKLEAALIREHRPRHNRAGRPRSAPMVQRIARGSIDVCARAGCRNPFDRTGQPNKRFCSDRCRNADWAERNRRRPSTVFGIPVALDPTRPVGTITLERVPDA